MRLHSLLTATRPRRRNISALHSCSPPGSASRSINCRIACLTPSTMLAPNDPSSGREYSGMDLLISRSISLATFAACGRKASASGRGSADHSSRLRLLPAPVPGTSLDCVVPGDALPTVPRPPIGRLTRRLVGLVIVFGTPGRNRINLLVDGCWAQFPCRLPYGALQW